MLSFFIGLAASTNLSDYKGPSPVSLFLYLFLFIAILGMAYFSTRLISKNVSKHYGKNMRVIEKLPLGLDRSLMIVQVGNVYYLLTNNKMGIEKIDKLDDFEPNEMEQMEWDYKESFKKVLDKYRK